MPDVEGFSIQHATVFIRAACCSGRLELRRMPHTLSLAVANRAEEVPKLVSAVESFGASAGLPDELLFRLMLALDEVVTNIVRHAFDDDRAHEIAIAITVDAGVVTVIVEDEGRPFDPNTVPPADVHAPLAHRPIGGLGVHLVRSVAQHMTYRRAEGRNELTLTLTGI
jgi:anti-sigma regulatory factor (Ser/Thr protein kinase)